MAENKTAVAKKQIDVSLADLGNAGGMLSMATTVTQFIKDNNLSTNIQGKNFVNVEGWQFAGGMIGVLPIVQSTENLSAGDELKYRASVELINIKTGQKVGAGIATCSNKESGKKFFAEYAIESMAQTRAVGKAYRLMLGWLMKAAGYEATPAEEMDFQNAQVVESMPAPAEPVMQVRPAVELADKSIRDSLLLNLEGFKGLYSANDLAKMKTKAETLPAEGAETSKQKLQGDITKRILAKRAELNHAASPAQLDLIDKMLLSHKFTADEKAAFNTASYEYDNIDAANRIDWLTAEMKQRNTPAAA